MTVAALGDEDLGENPRSISAGVTSQRCCVWACTWALCPFPRVSVSSPLVTQLLPLPLPVPTQQL